LPVSRTARLEVSARRGKIRSGARERELDRLPLVLRRTLLGRQRTTEPPLALFLGLLELDVLALETSRHRTDG
jgi:hypothetical protein